MLTISNIIQAGVIASLGFGVIYLVMWFNQRSKWAYLWFACSVFSVAFFAWVELRSMDASTVEDFVRIRHWGHLATLLTSLSFLFFVRTYLQAGILWVFVVTIILRVAATIIDFFSPYSINFSFVSSLKEVTFLGEKMVFAETTPNPWMLVAHVSLFFLLYYCTDAAIRVWRRGERQKAIVGGGSVILFIASATAMAIVVNWSLAEIPLVISPFFLGTVAFMGYELSRQALRSQSLATELEIERAELLANQESLNVAAEAGNVGVWVREIDTGKMVSSPRWRSIFGFSETEPLTFELFLSRIHTDDRENVILALDKAKNGSGHYETEYRIVLDDGATRWISSRGKIETSPEGFKILYGASADITLLKAAEFDAHNLSSRLIVAQEEERSRLAREIHDDLSQGLALLSIHVDSIGVHSTDGAPLGQKLEVLSERIRRISSDVHRISHTLHPELLHQLGLVASIKEFCSEIEETRGLRVEFSTSESTIEPPDDVALCFFRITQESLQNVARHSGSTTARVYLLITDTKISLTISDNGRGFDLSSEKIGDSLGLLSMRERIRSVNGSLDVDSSPGRGTTVTARSPLSFY